MKIMNQILFIGIKLSKWMTWLELIIWMNLNNLDEIITHKIDHMDEIDDDKCDFNDMEEINNSHNIRCGRSMTI
jgi:hypothetical protein